MTVSVPPVLDNPLLAKLRVVDGITVKLPSGGLLYEEGVLHPDIIEGEIRVYPMTTRDDIALRSADGLFGGTAINQVLGRCAPGILDPSKLFFNDLDYLMVALRNVSYGSEMTIGFKHTCEGAKDHDYSVNVEAILQNTSYIDPLLIDSQFTYITSLGQEVKMHPIRVSEMMRIMKPPAAELTEEEVEEEVLKLFISQIYSVDNITDREMIYEWMGELHTKDLKAIRKRIHETSTWGVSYKQNITCRDCKETFEIETPINPVTFFS